MKYCINPGCDNPVFSHLYCKRHQYLRKDPKFKTHTYKKKPTGEMEMFMEIWNERKHVSYLTGRLLPEDAPIEQWVFMFHHVLPKSHYKKFRLNKDNVILLHPEEHFDIHNLSEDLLTQKYGEETITSYKYLVQQLKDSYQDAFL